MTTTAGGASGKNGPRFLEAASELSRTLMAGRWPGGRHARRFAKATIAGVSRVGLTRVSPRIVRRIAHDVRAYTQGLVHRDGWLYESTGGFVGSSLRRIDPGNGRIRDLIPVVGDFAEGIAVVGNRLFQLSWVSGKARVYALPGLAQIGEVIYEGEGWGLASGPTGLVMSDGSSVLQFRDESFEKIGERCVRSRRLPVRRLNDLEWVGRSLYANVLGSSDILEIAADTGKVIRIVDCSALTEAAAPCAADQDLNGIAYNEEEGTFILTGKKWRFFFEVEIPMFH